MPEVEVRADRVKRKNEVTASKAHTPGIIPGRKKTNAEIMAEARKNQEIEQNSPNPGGYKKPDVNLADVGRNFRKPGNVEIIYNQPQPNIQDIRDIATYDGGVLPTAVISAQRPNLRNEEVSVVNVPVERARQFPAEESRNPNYLTHEDVLNAESIKGQGQRQRGFFERVGRVAGGLQGAAGDQTSRISRNLGARVIKSVDRKLGSLVAPGQTQMVTPKNNVVTPG